jgi:hypothetical protein
MPNPTNCAIRGTGGSFRPDLHSVTCPRCGEYNLTGSAESCCTINTEYEIRAQ